MAASTTQLTLPQCWVAKALTQQAGLLGSWVASVAATQRLGAHAMTVGGWPWSSFRLGLGPPVSEEHRMVKRGPVAG
jgi:hypothetical protein